MKKKFLAFILCICFIIPAMFCLSACTQSPDIQFKVENGYVQYYNGKTWSNLIAIAELEGEDGDDSDVWTIGNDGYWYKNGVKQDQKAVGDVGYEGNGIKSIAPSTDPAKTNATQTTYIITLDDNSTYEFVVKNGKDGDDGKDSSYSKYLITYDYGKAKNLFDNNIDEFEIKSSEWLVNMPTIKEEYGNAFLGWYIKNEEREVKKYDFIGGNIILEARFDYKLLGLSGLYQNGKYTMTWNDIRDQYSDNVLDSEIVYNSNIPFFVGVVGDLIIDSSITSIGQLAFNGCGLTNIIIPDSVEQIYGSAFGNSKNLKNIKIGKGVSLIGTRTFANCDSLKNILIDDLNNSYASIDGNLYSKDKSVLIKWCPGKSENNITLPAGVVEIEDYAFQTCKNINTIQLSETVEILGSHLFQSCDNLQTIIFNSCVRGMHTDDAFINSSINTIIINVAIPQELNQATGMSKVISYESINTVYIKLENEITIYTMEEANFVKQTTSNKQGYYMWVRN